MEEHLGRHGRRVREVDFDRVPLAGAHTASLLRDVPTNRTIEKIGSLSVPLRERSRFETRVGRAGWRLMRVAEGNPAYDVVSPTKTLS